MLCCFVVWKARHTFRRQTRRRESGIHANTFNYFLQKPFLYLVRSGVSCSEDRQEAPYQAEGQWRHGSGLPVIFVLGCPALLFTVHAQ